MYTSLSGVGSLLTWAVWTKLIESLANTDTPELFIKLKLFPITLCFSLIYAKKYKFPIHFRKQHILGQTWFSHEKTKVMVD